MQRRSFISKMTLASAVATTLLPAKTGNFVDCYVLNSTNYTVAIIVEFGQGSGSIRSGHTGVFPNIDVCCYDVMVTAKYLACTTSRLVPIEAFGSGGSFIAQCKIGRTSPGIIRISI
jgi:hypothetical protein